MLRRQDCTLCNSRSDEEKLLSYNAVKLVTQKGTEVWEPRSRYYMKDLDDLEIISQVNSEIRGFYNYYAIANNSSYVQSFAYIMEYSMYKTYALKYQTSVSKEKTKSVSTEYSPFLIKTGKAT